MKTDKERSETCIHSERTEAFKAEDPPLCLAHLCEARVFDCGVWLGYSHLNRKNPVDRCCDFQEKVK